MCTVSHIKIVSHTTHMKQFFVNFIEKKRNFFQTNILIIKDMKKHTKNHYFSRKIHLEKQSNDVIEERATNLKCFYSDMLIQSNSKSSIFWQLTILLTRYVVKNHIKIFLNCVKIFELWINNLLFNFVKIFYIFQWSIMNRNEKKKRWRPPIFSPQSFINIYKQKTIISLK